MEPRDLVISGPLGKKHRETVKIVLTIPLKHNFYIFFAVTLVCYGFSIFVGYEQYKAWKTTPTKYFANETPMMTTLDSYFWIRRAKEYKEEGSTQKGKDLLRYFRIISHYIFLLSLPTII